jgi:sulfopyruvate decarboxylase TPP-binding subunit
MIMDNGREGIVVLREEEPAAGFGVVRTAFVAIERVLCTPDDKGLGNLIQWLRNASELFEIVAVTCCSWTGAAVCPRHALYCLLIDSSI